MQGLRINQKCPARRRARMGHAQVLIAGTIPRIPGSVRPRLRARLLADGREILFQPKPAGVSVRVRPVGHSVARPQLLIAGGRHRAENTGRTWETSKFDTTCIFDPAAAIHLDLGQNDMPKPLLERVLRSGRNVMVCGAVQWRVAQAADLALRPKPEAKRSCVDPPSPPGSGVEQQGRNRRVRRQVAKSAQRRTISTRINAPSAPATSWSSRTVIRRPRSVTR